MNDAGELPPLLLGLFRELRANGVAVGVRDYLDGLRALRLGHGAGSRQALRELALALWARSEAERRLIARWFDAIPEVPPTLLERVEGVVSTLEESVHAGTSGERSRRTTIPPAVPPPTASSPGKTGGAAGEARARISFAARHEGEGLPLPRLPLAPQIAEHYVLQPQAAISARNLAVLWRRFRRSTRSGAGAGQRSEIDLPATIRERCRRGLLARPVCRPPRSNCARLMVLADASTSMDPWRPFLATLAASLPLGRLASAELRYFANLPRRKLFADVELTQAEPLDDLLRRNAGAALLIVSDAGSARGYLNHRRARQTIDFLAAAARRFAAIVWLNPMPAARWRATTAERIADAPAADGRPRLPMLPLDAASLLRAVDILRGQR